MRKNLHTILSFSLLLIAVIGCKEEFPFGSEPIITLQNYGPNAVVEFTDSIYFQIGFEDGDGDLGENNTDDHNLIVEDNRNGIKYTYRISELVPGGANVPIKGVLRFSINNTFIIGNGPTEEVTYSIHVLDRAGHTSNTVTTGPIIISQ